MSVWLLPLLVLGITLPLSVPVGFYLAWVMDGRYRPPAWLRRVEGLVDTGTQSGKQYLLALLAFNALLFGVGFLLLALQPVLPLNPDGKGMLAPTTIFHTVISFVTNNSLQHYAGEQHLSYFSQVVVIVGNMFLGGAVSLCALVAVVRGLRGDPQAGNFSLDLWRGVAYVFFPASLLVGVLLLAAGVPMTFQGAAPASPPEDPGQAQTIARGPVAILVPVKNLASVGGGFFGANSAHPFENPNAWVNLLQCVSILIFPTSVVVMFGRMLGRPRHAAILYGVMLSLFVGLLAWTVSWDALRPNPSLTGRAAGTLVGPGLPPLPVDQEGPGNLEGKELRFGPSGAATFVAVTTAVSCGSVNCMHDSLNPLAGLTPLTGMWLNCVFGGKGIGLVNLLMFLVITVFLTGLMVGRTPEYLGKKIEAREMKLAMLAFLPHPLLILAPSALFAATDWGTKATSNPGAHGLTQIVYEFSSSSAGNGSGMEGLGDTWGLNDPEKDLSAPAPYSRQWDVATGLVMLLSRFLPIVAAVLLAHSLAAKTPTPFTVGTLRTDTVTFGVVLLGIVLLLGALAFLPVIALGPAAEHFGPMPFGG
jgi:K+-transporting ATPase ATPase A chain